MIWLTATTISNAQASMPLRPVSCSRRAPRQIAGSRMARLYSAPSGIPIMPPTIEARIAALKLASTKVPELGAADAPGHVEIMVGDNALVIVENGLEIHDAVPLLPASRLAYWAPCKHRSPRPAQEPGRTPSGDELS